MKNELSRELSIANEKVQYDTQCKRVLSQKIILAWIIQRTVKEFQGMTVDEIIPCIEGTPEIAAVRVNPGETNDEEMTAVTGIEKITGITNEDKVPGEGEVYYDIRFLVYVPSKNERIRMIMNVEAQKSFHPGYEIVTRGIFYAARMISAQLGTEFVRSEYDNIKKVYSIWLCMNAPKKIGNAISEYCIRKSDLLSGLPDLPGAYDKISVIVIALNDKVESTDQFVNMMNTLLSTDKTYIQKREALEKDYHIRMSEEMGKEYGIMCNLSDLVEEKAIKRGMKKGIEKGIEKGMEMGMEQGKKDMVSNLLKLGTVTEEDIMKASGISREQLEEIKEDLLVAK